MTIPPILRKGSTLLAVFWIIAILGFAVFTSLGLVLQQMEVRIARSQDFRAQQLIESAVALASHPVVTPGDPLLAPADAPPERVEVSLESEAARFHLNVLLTSAQTDLLEAIFRAWGLAPTDAETLRDQLHDWVDGDDLTRAKGAERDVYTEAGFPNQPFNRPFRSLDEVSLVPAMARVEESYPAWRDWFTLWSQTGLLDLNAAPPDRLAVALGVSPESAAVLTRTRNGPDGLPGTEDDLPFSSVADSVRLAGALFPEVAAARLTLSDPVQRITVTARVGDYGVRRVMVLRREGTPQLHHWNEEVVP